MESNVKSKGWTGAAKSVAQGVGGAAGSVKKAAARAKDAVTGSRAVAGAKATASSAKSIAVRVILAVCALVVCALPPIFVNNIIGYLPLVALVIMLVVSFAYLQVLKRAFSFSEESLVSSCERGHEIDFVLHFRNASPLVFLRLEPTIYVSNLFDEVDDVTPVPLTLMPFENREFRFQATFDHIGTYSAGVQKIVINDLLGLFTHTIVNEQRHKVEVLPRLVELDSVPLSSEVSSESQKPRQAFTVDDMDYAGVREYTWGDPIKTIHWKLSAREPSGNYLTRLFETFNNPGISIIMDLSAPPAQRYSSDDLMCVFDGIVESALSMNQFALSQGIESVLTFRSKYGDDAKLRLMSVKDFPDLTQILPRIKPGDGIEAREILRREMNTLHGQDNVAFVTSQVNEEVLSMLVTLKLRKRNPLLVLLVPPSMGTEEARTYAKPLRRLNEAQIPYFVLTSASDFAGEKGGRRS